MNVGRNMTVRSQLNVMAEGHDFVRSIEMNGSVNAGHSVGLYQFAALLI